MKGSLYTRKEPSWSHMELPIVVIIKWFRDPSIVIKRKDQDGSYPAHWYEYITSTDIILYTNLHLNQVFWGGVLYSVVIIIINEFNSIKLLFR